ncbi:MAG: hypothetical protein MUF43_09210 [Flavobacterium sp.]|jgi:hypothetical protein|nr:hypothetical protein [Flavobacterium sp.]
MSKVNVKVVVPVYRESLNENEKISWRRCVDVFGYDNIIIVKPCRLELNVNYFSNRVNHVSFDDKNFRNLYSYSRLLCKPKFYSKFLNLDFILIYQLDAFVFENDLEEWCLKDYSYIGAPWMYSDWINNGLGKKKWLRPLLNFVGNGGLSLRKVKHFYWGSFLLQPVLFFWPQRWHEDFFWSFWGPKLIPFFNLPTVGDALNFSFEENPKESFNLNDKKLPFGCHAWEKFDYEFWIVHFNRLGYFPPK